MSNKNRVQDEDSFSKSLTKQIESLERIKNDDDLFNIAYAIAPDSVASGCHREQILDTITDILMSRF